MKFFSLILIVIALFMTSCETAPSVKREPISISEVHWVGYMDGNILIPKQNGQVGYNPATGTMEQELTKIPIRSVIKDCQYIGKINWSGTLPEIQIPESAYTLDLRGQTFQLPYIPERVKTEMRDDAAKMGANLVMFDAVGYKYRWVMQDGRLQPFFYFFGKGYFYSATNAAFPHN
jgi:hypothetical protein